MDAALLLTFIPANLQSTEVGIAFHKNREIEEKNRRKSLYYRQKSGYLKQNNAKSRKSRKWGGSDAEYPEKPG